MPNQLWRQPRNMIPKDLLVLIFGIVIIGAFINIIYSHINPTVTATSLNDVNIPSTYNINDPNSSGYPIQNSPSVNNTLNSGNGNNDITTGDWVLLVSNGTFQQFSVSAQVYTFLLGLIESDSKGTGTVKVFLVVNGQINQYSVSNKVYSIISNMAAIDTPASNVSPNPIPYVSPNPTPYVSPNPTPYVLP